jgi:5-hydroxyisourate hydrolase
MISTHVLDTSLGHPARDVVVELEKKSGSGWTSIAKEKTNAEGRIVFACAPEAGVFRLQFHVDSYFKANQAKSFFTEVPVIFEITDTGRKYHVPLLLTPYGYTTYRGS